MAVKDGGPAFPFDVKADEYNGRFVSQGMSLRDYFAAAALGRIELKVYNEDFTAIHAGTVELHVKAAYMVADAMLAERDKVNS